MWFPGLSLIGYMKVCIVKDFNGHGMARFLIFGPRKLGNEPG